MLLCLYVYFYVCLSQVGILSYWQKHIIIQITLYDNPETLFFISKFLKMSYLPLNNLCISCEMTDYPQMGVVRVM